MDKFKIIQEKELSSEIVEKKSRFIANLFYVESVEEAEEKIKLIKKKYHDARHNCSAYIVCNNNETIKKANDDGEPSGTAGAPMLDILDKQGIANVLVVVTRYFGGILLGTGGLVRAYSEALKSALENATLTTQEPGFELTVELEYADVENFRYYCKTNGILITNCEYMDSVVCKIELNEQCKNELEKEFYGQNKLRIIKIDNIRQKNISVLSENVD
ncbi:MAG: YigZ family protein [Clostridia bacterium]|nr:YigZ family protein [Clostridia bacterium]